MRKRALEILALISACLTASGRVDARQDPALVLTTLQCASEVARTLRNHLGSVANVRVDAPLSCDKPAPHIESWSKSATGVPVLIVDQDRANQLIPDLTGWQIWRPDLSAEVVVSVARASAADVKANATLVTPEAWLERRGAATVVKVGYLSVMEGAAAQMIRAEIQHPVEPHRYGSLSELAAALNGHQVDVALVPGDHGEHLYRELAQLATVPLVRFDASQWRERVRFTTGAGAAYVPIPAAGGAANFGLLRAERSRGGLAFQRFSHGDNQIVAAFRRLAQQEEVNAAGGVDFKFPVILTTRGLDLDRHSAFKQRLAVAFFMTAFRFGTTGGHLCESSDQAAAYLSYCVNAYLTSPSDVNFCGLWSQYRMAAQSQPFPYAAHLGALPPEYTKRGAAAAVDPDKFCVGVIMPSRPREIVACNPPKETGFALQRRDTYVHGLILMAEALDAKVPQDRDRKLAEALTCLSITLDTNSTPACRTFARANWLTFYDPFLPLAVMKLRESK